MVSSARQSAARARQIAFGQNFLHSRRLVSSLVTSADLGADDVVIEIGPGRGIITDALSTRCRHVLAIEKDPHHAEILRTRYAHRANVTVFGADFLDFPLPATPYKVFSSIPFNISASIIGKLTSGEAPPADAWLVVQRETAERFQGEGGETLASIRLQPWFTPSIEHRFRRQDFTPMPRVESVLLRLRRIDVPLIARDDRERYEEFVTTIFSAWKPSVATALETILARTEVASLRKSIGDDLNARPGETPISLWIELFGRLTERDDPRVWRRCREAANRWRMHQSKLRKRTQTPVRRPHR